MRALSFPDDAQEAVTYSPAPERIVAGDPVQTAQTVFSSADGRFQSGIWTAQKGAWRVVFTESEFCHLVEGVIKVTSDDGTVQLYKAGDAFVSPAGFTGIWEIVEPAKKYYAFYE